MKKLSPQIKKVFEPYVDQWGLISEIPWEGGDSACETFGALCILKMAGYDEWLDGRPLHEAYEDIASKLIHPKGLWRRHCARYPHGRKNYWAALWWYGSRDNGTTALMATILFGDKKRTQAILELCRRRYWISPMVLPRNVYAWEIDHKRYSPAWKEYDPTPRFGSPLLMWKSFFNRSVERNGWTLWFWDCLSCLLPVLSVRKQVKKRSSGNHLNAIIRSHFCKRYRPTLVSRLAFKLLPRDAALELEFPMGGKNPPMGLLVELLYD